MLKTGLFIWRGLDNKFETIEDDIGQMRSPSWVRTRPASSALAHWPADTAQPSPASPQFPEAATRVDTGTFTCCF